MTSPHAPFVAITCCDSDGRLKLFALDSAGNVWEYAEHDSTWYFTSNKRDNGK